MTVHRAMQVVYKALIYRMYSFLVLLTIGTVFTGDTAQALKFAAGIEMVKFIQYVLFEKIWGAVTKTNK